MLMRARVCALRLACDQQAFARRAPFPRGTSSADLRAAQQAEAVLARAEQEETDAAAACVTALHSTRTLL